MKRRQRGADWYMIDGQLVRPSEKPGLIDWTPANQFRAAAAIGMIVILVVVGVHAFFVSWDKQIAIDDAKNVQQWSDFYAAQGE